MSREQAIPEDSWLEAPTPRGAADFKTDDPDLYRDVQNVIGALRQDMIPTEVQEQIFSSMNTSVQRSLIAEASGLDESVLVTFKHQLGLVDSILRRTFNSDGTLATGSEGMGIEPKDVLGLSLKVSQMMVRELPKVYNMERVQRMETALFRVISEKMTKEQQEDFLQEMERQSVGL